MRPPICLLRNLYADQEQEVEPDMEQRTEALIGYLLNNNNGDRVFKMSNEPNRAPSNMEKPNHELGYRHSRELSMKCGDDKGSCW